MSSLAGHFGANPAAVAAVTTSTLVDHLDPAIVIARIGATSADHIERDIHLALRRGCTRQSYIRNMIRDETMARDLVVLLRVGIDIEGATLIVDLGGTGHFYSRMECDALGRQLDN